MAEEKQPLTMEIGGLTEKVPELSIGDHIPPPGAAIETLISILPALPGKVMEIAGNLPDMLHMPDFDMEAGQ